MKKMSSPNKKKDEMNDSEMDSDTDFEGGIELGSLGAVAPEGIPDSEEMLRDDESVTMTNAMDASEESEKTVISAGATMSRRIAEATKTPPSIMMLEGPAGYVGKQWPIEKNELIIGRSMTSHVFVDDKSVSRSHTKIILKDNDVYVMDLESSNKTVVNDEAIPPMIPIKLKDNDTIKTGNVLFKFRERGSLEAHAHERLQEKSERDPLTGAYNKGALAQRGQESFKRAKLLKVPISIAVFDIDYFKKINDDPKFGHPGGDYVLKDLVNVISTKLIRADDFLARYGGEEFVVILFGSNLQQAAEIGERLRQTIESHNFVYNGHKIPVTISVGVATKQAEMSTWEELFAVADTAVYASKRGGRNRVTSADSTGITSAT
ncbi:MAG: diguanylate cyclase [Bdellovibrionales bacterium]|jgi:diguanylate cyclase (GGDEF)-like protein|nr:diguanylate cyclase [Bdellovibrionales bacterium]